MPDSKRTIDKAAYSLSEAVKVWIESNSNRSFSDVWTINVDLMTGQISAKMVNGQTFVIPVKV